MGIFLDLEAAFDWVGYSGLSCWLLRQLPHDFPPAALTALRQWLLWVSGPSPLLALHILGSLCHPHVPSTQLGTSSLLLFSELQTRYPTASWWLLLNDLQDPPPRLTLNNTEMLISFKRHYSSMSELGPPPPELWLGIFLFLFSLIQSIIKSCQPCLQMYPSSTICIFYQIWDMWLLVLF